MPPYAAQAQLRGLEHHVVGQDGRVNVPGLFLVEGQLNFVCFITSPQQKVYHDMFIRKRTYILGSTLQKSAILHTFLTMLKLSQMVALTWPMINLSERMFYYGLYHNYVVPAFTRA